MTDTEFAALKQAAYQHGVRKVLTSKQAQTKNPLAGAWHANAKFLATAAMLGIPVGVLLGVGAQQTKSLGHEMDMKDAKVQYYHGLTNKLKDQLRTRGIPVDEPEPEDT